MKNLLGKRVLPWLITVAFVLLWELGCLALIEAHLDARCRIEIEANREGANPGQLPGSECGYRARVHSARKIRSNLDVADELAGNRLLEQSVGLLDIRGI